MTVSETTRDAESELHERLARQIESDGYAVLHDALPQAILTELLAELEQIDPDDFRSAAIGRHGSRQVNLQRRSDRIVWIDERHSRCQPYLDWMEQLRLALNGRLFLGLFDYECHIARYAPSARYEKHLDAFSGNTSRILSTVLYLNDNWQSGDGGELAIYPPLSDDDSQPEPLCIVPPRLGTLVVFLSEQFPHEVFAAHSDRYSVAGWFRVSHSQR